MDPIHLTYIIPAGLLLLAMIFVIYAQIKVNSTFNKYSKVHAECNLKASEVASKLLESNGVSASVMRTKGKLTDSYNSRTKEIKLSEPVYDSTSVAAIGVAAHETGHAIQDAKKYVPMRLRTAAVKFGNFASSLFMPLILLGTMFWFVLAGTLVGLIFIVVALLLFILGFVVNLVTLPVELNASRRAKAALSDAGILTANEQKIVKKVLNAAALTYVASLAVSLIALLRLIFFFVAASDK